MDAETKQANERFKGVKEVLSWFFNFTSLAGVTQVRDTDTFISKCVWSILAVAGYCMTLYGVVASFKGFMLHEFSTKIGFDSGVGFQRQLEFPSVTVCNNNRIHCGHLYTLINTCNKVTSH